MVYESVELPEADFWSSELTWVIEIICHLVTIDLQYIHHNVTKSLLSVPPLTITCNTSASLALGPFNSYIQVTHNSLQMCSQVELLTSGLSSRSQINQGYVVATLLNVAATQIFVANIFNVEHQIQDGFFSYHFVTKIQKFMKFILYCDILYIL